MRKETVYLIVRPKRDKRGNPITPQTDPIPISGCIIYPRASSEITGGDVGVEGQNIVMPDNATAQSIRTDAHISLRGQTHAVDEPPQRYAGKRIFVKTRKVDLD